MKYKVKQAKTLETIELKYEVDDASEKVKLPIFEDGTDEQFLKLVKEFSNMITTYELWNKPYGNLLVYRSFRRCLARYARDLWDQVNVIDDKEERDELTIDTHLKEFTLEVIGEDAY
jgi:hypothetical protein